MSISSSTGKTLSRLATRKKEILVALERQRESLSESQVTKAELILAQIEKEIDKIKEAIMMEQNNYLRNAKEAVIDIEFSRSNYMTEKVKIEERQERCRKKREKAEKLRLERLKDNSMLHKIGRQILTVGISLVFTIAMVATICMVWSSWYTSWRFWDLNTWW